MYRQFQFVDSIPLVRLEEQFYTARCTSAERGIEIACRLSVRLSVTLVDQNHIGWKSWKLIVRSIRPTPSLFVVQRPST